MALPPELEGEHPIQQPKFSEQTLSSLHIAKFIESEVNERVPVWPADSHASAGYGHAVSISQSLVCG